MVHNFCLSTVKERKMFHSNLFRRRSCSRPAAGGWYAAWCPSGRSEPAPAGLPHPHAAAGGDHPHPPLLRPAGRSHGATGPPGRQRLQAARSRQDSTATASAAQRAAAGGGRDVLFATLAREASRS